MSKGMPGRGRRFGPCQSKVYYATKEQAAADLGAVRAGQLARNAPKVAAGVYHCAGCDGWHLTSQPQVEDREYRPWASRPLDAHDTQQAIRRLQGRMARR